MKKFKFTISGNEYEVEIDNHEDNIVDLDVNGTKYSVELHQEVIKTKTPTLVRSVIKNTGGEKIGKVEKGAAKPVNAPLPGSILQVFVNVGDIVKKGDKILVMEAMKMENQVLAEKDGVVESIKVSAGDAVLQGDVLIEII